VLLVVRMLLATLAAGRPSLARAQSVLSVGRRDPALAVFRGGRCRSQFCMVVIVFPRFSGLQSDAAGL
jgi:hypothetical protein